jgi:molecular chaperone DnaK
LNVQLTRTKFEQMIEGVVKQSLEPCKKALKDSGLSLSDIHEVILVGGTTRIPAIQKAVKDFFGKEPHKGVNPDEVVAIGAAIQGAVLAGDVKDVVLLDVTPLSLGIETMGGVFTKLIERNTTIPTSKSQVFSTAADGQTSVEIHALQGEREMAANNRSLGRFVLEGIPSAPRGVPQVEVTFDLDANGILHVKALDKGTGKSQKITITASSGLSDADIERMRQDAEAHADEDKKKRELIDTRHRADGLVYSAEKTLTESADKLSEESKQKLTTAIADLKAILGSEDKEAMDAAIETAQKTIYEVSAELYKETDAASDSTETAQKQSDDVVDAEFTEVDEKQGKA